MSWGKVWMTPFLYSWCCSGYFLCTPCCFPSPTVILQLRPGTWSGKKELYSCWRPSKTIMCGEHASLFEKLKKISLKT